MTIPETSAEVVGRYYCIFESSDNSDHDVDLEDLEADYKATSTYLFVKDPKSPIVPVSHTVVYAQQYEDVVIPCKPSSKDVIVELVKDEQEVISIEDTSCLMLLFQIFHLSSEFQLSIFPP